MVRLVLPLAIACCLPALSAVAHDWYPASCCSGQDCRPIDAREVRTTPNGWEIPKTGEVIPYGDRREQFSPDGKFHRCSRYYANPVHNDSTICLFVPGMAS